MKKIILIPEFESVGDKIEAVKDLEMIIEGIRPVAAVGVLQQALLRTCELFIKTHSPGCECTPLAMAKATIRAIAEIQREILQRHGMKPEEHGWPDPMKNIKFDQGEKNDDQSGNSGSK